MAKSDIIKYTPTQCKSLVIALIIAITSLSTTCVYLYRSKEKGIKDIYVECEKKLSKKDEIIMTERSRNEMIIDSILRSQRKQIEYLTIRKKWK